MARILLSSLTLLLSLAWAKDTPLPHNDQEWGYAIHQHYSEEEESTTFWEDLTSPFRALFESRTLGRITKLGKAASSAVCGDFKGAGEYFANSIVNPFLTVESLISDVSSALTHDQSELKRTHSPRAQLCVVNFPASSESDPNLLLEAVTPFQHVGIILDGTTEINFGGAYLGNHPAQRQCKEMPLISDMPIGASIQMMKCLHQRMKHTARYNFVNYNCGGYTRDIAEASGYEFNDVPNAGIGSLYPLLVYSPERIAINNQMPSLIQECKNQVIELQKIYVALELGKKITPEQSRFFDPKNGYANELSSSAALQLLASAARSGSPESRQQVEVFTRYPLITRSEFSRLNEQINNTNDPANRAAALKTVRDIMRDIPAEGIEWIKNYLGTSNNTAALIDAIEGKRR